MRRLLIALLVVAALAGGGWLALKRPVADTTTAALKAFPVYSFVRTRNDQLLRIAHAGGEGQNLLIHRVTLAGPRDRSVTTPNNDTLYSSAFLDLSAGPVQLTMPPLPDRYHSAHLMDARTDAAFIAGTRDGGAGGRLEIAYAAGQRGCAPPDAQGVRTCLSPTREAWLLIRTLVDGPADLAAAKAAQSGFTLQAPAGPGPEAVVLPAVPDPAMLLRRANPLIAANPHLADPALAATGYGGGADAFDTLPLWRQWLWRILWPRIVARMQDGIAAGARATGDGWSKSPPGIGTAEASDAIRAAVALGGLGALPKDEAVYWSAVEDRGGADLVAGSRYRLTIPAEVPAGAFWSLSLYERLPDGRLFYVENPIDRYAIGNRTPGLVRAADGSLVVTLQTDDPGPGANWLPAPRDGAFTLVFRAYLPEAPILSGSWRLPAVEKLAADAPAGN